MCYDYYQRHCSEAKFMSFTLVKDESSPPPVKRIIIISLHKGVADRRVSQCSSNNVDANTEDKVSVTHCDITLLLYNAERVVW